MERFCRLEGHSRNADLSLVVQMKSLQNSKGRRMDAVAYNANASITLYYC